MLNASTSGGFLRFACRAISPIVGSGRVALEARDEQVQIFNPVTFIDARTILNYDLGIKGSDSTSPLVFFSPPEDKCK